jgi:hypothetical protein
MTVAQEQDVSESRARTFVCYARHDENFVITVAGALVNRGIPIWIDQWHVQPGADWSKAIDAALNACTTFVIVLSPEAVGSDEVQGELRVALNQRKRIIPVIYRPCRIPRQLLLRQHIDFSRSAAPTEAAIDRLANALQTGERNHDFPQTHESDDTARRTLLDDVSAETRVRLQAIGTDQLLPILLEPQPQQVARPWDHEVTLPVKPRAAPPVSDILEVFDDDVTGGRLLILGAPGSGKTTALLQLMQALVGRALADPARPVPVLLSLASWKDDKPIGEWIVDEMKAKYGVRGDLGIRWRRTHRIAILLDGLDELSSERLPLCVDAINEFDRADRPSCLVVSCRQSEYENLAVKLRLRGAASLQPLTDEAIRDYLAHAGRAELWNAIETDPDLVDMARSPLLLSFMTGLADAPDGQRWQNAPSAERRRRLFDSYVAALTPPDGSRHAYSRDQMLRWLRQLATMLRRQGRAEFLIEQMQPQWMETRLQRWSYRVGVFILSAVLAAIVLQSTLTLFGLVPMGDLGRALQAKVPSAMAEGSSLSQPLLWMIAAAVGGLIASRKIIVPVETLTWSWGAAWMGLRRWSQAAAWAGLDYGLGLGVIASLIWEITHSDFANLRSWQTAGDVCGTIFSSAAAVYLALVRPSSWLPFLRRPRITRQVMEALALASLYALLIGVTWTGVGGLLSGVAMFCIFGLSWAATARARSILVHGLITGLVCGVAIAGISASWSAVPFLAWLSVWVNGGVTIGSLAGMAIALATRTTERRALTIPPPTTWRRFMPVVVLAIALGVAAAVSLGAGFTAPVNGIAVFVWWSQVSIVRTLGLMVLAGIGGAVFGCISAGVLGALAGALGGATGADVERRLVPNQGIRQSAMNVVIFAAAGVLIIGIPYGLFNVAIASIAVQMLPSPSDWLRLGIGAGASFGVLAGLLPGAACIQHFVLRAVLWANGALPLRYAAFLDFATERRLLQRVGGRYRFIHVLLRDYLGGGHATTAA